MKDMRKQKLRLGEPSAVDELMEQAQELDLALRDRCDPLEQMRRAQLRLTDADPRSFLQVVEATENNPHPLSRGIRLLAQVGLELYEDVSRVDVEPKGATPLELEDSCHAHYAAAISHAELGNLRRAAEHAHSAITLATALGMRHRLQTLTIELCRINNLAGVSNAETLRQLMAQPMAPRRRQWGCQNLAEAHMGIGQYTAALNSLGLSDNDSPSEAGLREFLHRVLRLPPARPAGHPLLGHDQYSRLAEALTILGVRDGQMDLSGVTGVLEKSYGQLIESIALVRVPGQAGTAATVLGSTPPARLDQRIYWGVIRLSTFVEGAVEVDPLEVFAVLEDALAQVRNPTEILQVIQHLAPERYMLLLFSPAGQRLQDLGLTAISMLVGSAVLVNGKLDRLPSQTGLSLVLQAANSPDYEDIVGYKKARLEKKLGEYGGLHRLANLGWVARAIYKVRAYAALMNDESAVTEWDKAYQRVWELLDDDVRQALSEFPPAQ